MPYTEDDIILPLIVVHGLNADCSFSLVDSLPSLFPTLPSTTGSTPGIARRPELYASLGTLRIARNFAHRFTHRPLLYALPMRRVKI